jgi:hypothetical protein
VVWDVLLAALTLHVLVIALYALVKGHNLLRPMLSGYKPLPATIAAPRQKPVLLAALLLLISAAIVILLAVYL